jgi:rod shape-determining protein MreC
VARAGNANTRLDRTFLIVCAALSCIALVLPPPVREPIAGWMRRTLLAPMVMLQERAELSRRAFLDHDTIVWKRDSVVLQRMTLTALQAENSQLRDLIGLGSRLQWGFIPAEALHGSGVRDDFGVTLTAGSRAGVQRLDPIVAPAGLVGVVDNVDPTMSHAMLWTNSNFAVSAMTEDASAFGIVQANVASGPGRYVMEMRGVPYRTSIKLGTKIVSSGLGGVYPRGIPLGQVIGETQTNESWARTYLIRPAVLPSDVSSVMILRANRATQGVDNVWTAGTFSDSTIRRIVVAGDSMARRAALAEAQARQAALDSARRDSLRAAGVPSATPPQAPSGDSTGVHTRVGGASGGVVKRSHPPRPADSTHRRPKPADTTPFPPTIG